MNGKGVLTGSGGSRFKAAAHAIMAAEKLRQTFKVIVSPEGVGFCTN